MDATNGWIIDMRCAEKFGSTNLQIDSDNLEDIDDLLRKRVAKKVRRSLMKSMKGKFPILDNDTIWVEEFSLEKTHAIRHHLSKT